ncbi:SRPBCC family protein [Microbacterium sp. DT81.1]|uniref:SRPBCC family protein n=1 Tax=Microbacterium sp. DT81.1 TaxID=3393413 RepID=UPI003CE6F0E8
MKSFQFTEHIKRPPRDVFAVIADPREATRFLDNITDSTKLTDGPIGVGSTFRETRVVSGKQSSADLRITEYEPYTHVGVSTAAEGITVTYQYRLATEGEGTRLDWTCELDADGLRRMMLPLVAAIMKKEDGDHLQRLKVYIETQRDEPT